MDFKQRLKELRKENHLSQAELASVLNYGYTTIANYESGRNFPKINDLIRLANTFDVSVDYLIGNSNIKHYQYATLQENIAKETLKNNIELSLMDNLIICFLYHSLKEKQPIFGLFFIIFCIYMYFNKIKWVFIPYLYPYFI